MKHDSHHPVSLLKGYPDGADFNQPDKNYIDGDEIRCYNEEKNGRADDRWKKKGQNRRGAWAFHDVKTDGEFPLSLVTFNG